MTNKIPQRARPKAETYFIESLRLLAERIQERADLITNLANAMESTHPGCFVRLNHTVSVKDGLSAIEKLAKEGFEKLAKGQWDSMTVEFIEPLAADGPVKVDVGEGAPKKERGSTWKAGDRVVYLKKKGKQKK